MVGFVTDLTINMLFSQYQAASFKRDAAGKQTVKRKLFEHVNREIVKYTGIIGEIKGFIDEKVVERAKIDAQLKAVYVRNKQILERLEATEQRINDAIDAITPEDRQTHAGRNQLAILLEKQLQVGAFIAQHRERAKQEEDNLRDHIASIEGEIARLDLKRSKFSTRCSFAKDVLEQVKIRVSIIDAEYELALMQSNYDREFSHSKDGTRFSKRTSIMDVQEFCVELKDLDVLRERIISQCEKLAKLYGDIAELFSDGQVASHLAKLSSDYQSCEYQARSISLRKNKSIADFYRLADRFALIAEEYESLKSNEATRLTYQAKVEHLKQALEIVGSDEEKAMLYLKIAEHYYVEALRLRYTKPDDMELAQASYASHKEFLVKAQETDEKKYAVYLKKHRFLDRGEFFQSHKRDIYHRLNQAFFMWFNPVNFIRTLVEFNRECNKKSANMSTEDMYGVTQKSLTYVFRRYDTKALLALDKRVRESQAFNTFMTLLAWLVSNPHGAQVAYKESKKDNFNAEFKTQLALQSPKKNETFQDRVNHVLSLLFYNIAKLIYSFLDALKNELDSRQMYKGSYSFKMTSEFDGSENLKPSLYHKYCLHQISHNFSFGDWKFLDAEASVEQEAVVDNKHDAQVSDTQLKVF